MVWCYCFRFERLFSLRGYKWTLSRTVGRVESFKAQSAALRCSAVARPIQDKTTVAQIQPVFSVHGVCFQEMHVGICFHSPAVCALKSLLFLPWEISQWNVSWWEHRSSCALMVLCLRWCLMMHTLNWLWLPFIACKFPCPCLSTAGGLSGKGD